MGRRRDCSFWWHLAVLLVHTSQMVGDLGEAGHGELSCPCTSGSDMLSVLCVTCGPWWYGQESCPCVTWMWSCQEMDWNSWLYLNITRFWYNENNIIQINNSFLHILIKAQKQSTIPENSGCQRWKRSWDLQVGKSLDEFPPASCCTSKIVKPHHTILLIGLNRPWWQRVVSQSWWYDALCSRMWSCQRAYKCYQVQRPWQDYQRDKQRGCYCGFVWSFKVKHVQKIFQKPKFIMVGGRAARWSLWRKLRFLARRSFLIEDSSDFSRSKEVSSW